VLRSQLGDRFLIKIFVFSWQQFEEEMKKIFLIVFSILLVVSCDTEFINNPVVGKNGTFNYTLVNGDESLNFDWGTRSITYQDGKNNPITIFIGEDAGRYFGIKDGNFVVENGAITAKKAVFNSISLGGKNIEQVSRWRGELYEPPQDGVSGDEYYDRNTKKILKFIQSGNRWIER